MTYYRSTVVDVGPETPDLIAGGVVILFGEPLPEALAEISVVHRPSQTLDGHLIAAGDTVVIGSQELTVTAVGEIATKNLDELGHVVLYLNPDEGRQPMPGAVFAAGTLSGVEAGHEIEFRAGS